MSYVFEHEGKAFGPDGVVLTSDVEAHNKALEAAEIEAIKNNPPDRLFLYVGTTKDVSQTDAVTTWLGTVLGLAWLGPRRNIGFDKWTYRRAITTRIHGTLYHGWYYESSGSYCRLKKAKRQSGNCSRYCATNYIKRENGGAQ